MDQLQDELASEAPDLDIRIVGVNEIGHESGNAQMTSGRDLAWLQDVDADSDGMSDVWSESWDVEFRDVIIVDPNNVRLGALNLTTESLADPDNYELLKSTTLAVAADNPIWQNDANPLDVNDDSVVSAVGDVLTIVNELNNHTISDALGNLPVPAPASSPPYLDVNGDYVCSAVGDVLTLVNYLNGLPAAGGEGEGEAAPVSSSVTVVDARFIGASSSPELTAQSSAIALPALIQSQTALLEPQQTSAPDAESELEFQQPHWEPLVPELVDELMASQP